MATRPAGVRPRWLPAGADLGGPRPAEDGIASSGITFHLWRLYQHAWLICLLFPLVDLVRVPLAGERLSLGLGGLVFFAGGYTWLMWPHPASQAARARTRARSALLVWGLLTALVFVFSLGYGLAWLWLFIGAVRLCWGAAADAPGVRRGGGADARAPGAYGGHDR